jgi:RNA polymerase sigma factor (sigma-70 family)
MNASTEQNYLARAQNGDLRAFEQLLYMHEDAVYSFVYNKVRNEMDAEEITQDVFMKAYKNIKSFRKEAKLRTWLFTIAHNTTASHYRKKELKTTPVDDTPKAHGIASTIEESMSKVSDEERTRFIAQAMVNMAPQQRALIQLFYLEELSIKEICDITELSEASVKTGLNRGRNRLYQLLEEILKEEIHSLL